SANPADLRGAAFIRTTIGGTGFSFEGAQVDGINFSNVDFSDKSLVKVFQDVDTVKDEAGNTYENLRNLNLSYANFSNVTTPIDLSHVDLTGAHLAGTDFDYVNLTDAILDNLKGICDAQPENTSDLDPCQPEDNPIKTCMRLNNAMLTEASLKNIEFTNMLFNESVDGYPAAEFFQGVAGKDLSGVDFTGSAIAGFNFSEMDLTDAIISTALRICDSSIIPGEDGCANFQNAMFGSSDANAPLSFLTLNPGSNRFNFRGSNLVGATFTNVNLVNVDFDDIGNICETVDPAPENCLTIRGQNSSLFGSNFEGLDVKLIDFGDPEQEGSAGAMIDFQLVNFTLADFSTTSLTKRNMRRANFTGANLHMVDFSESILAEINSGCTNDANGNAVCTNFDDTTLRGVNAESAIIEGTFNNVDASSTECGTTSVFDNAVFIGVDLSTANFSQASMEGATFDASTSTVRASSQATCAASISTTPCPASLPISTTTTSARLTSPAATSRARNSWTRSSTSPI
ncbi:MAG TPA: pentapeptide repeat-containing protein, partial [Myxococcales bacterium]|nr:pentapeptide repeat-containing protein [Myxococcales bacterium]